MTDIELLEAAAKAAGLSYKNFSERWGGLRIQQPENSGEWYIWNPLTDDGEALRLAVRLRITPHIDGSMTEAKAATQAEGGFFAEPHIDDPYAATRRAIVRAAAAMGEKT